ncbi:endonuclease Q family protein [Paenibacillus sp. Marseille-Q4541]|uniref:endonuclease Q family protein n=1 Tax=Paenibacillus sp. Marseille-Q4541 TaxID=2831522 RepID=UPI001BA4AFF3|nr:endonuclease Q family protein [Paenibacillus sp. Marseille-Q4541]
MDQPFSTHAQTLRTYYADLHIHIGRTNRGEAVKISGSRNLTFLNIAKEAANRKGIELIGIVDAHAPVVQRDIREALDSGEMREIPGGGIAYRDTVILLGTELEVREPGLKEFHFLAFFRSLSDIESFTSWISPYMKNVNLSSQRIYVPVRQLQNEIVRRGGLFIPAHVFTPHKGIYGSSVHRMEEILDVSSVAAIELGLSADSEMAGYISELDPIPFLTNSDAHSLSKIGREYNSLRLLEPSFDEFSYALQNKDGRRIEANYGLNPRLGKYHRTYCASCNSILDEDQVTGERCSYCGSTKLVHGVLDRILTIADRDRSYIPPERPDYKYQVPLEFIPGLGKVKLRLLLEAFGSEMAILHRTEEAALSNVVGEELARYIVLARSGELRLSSGGGGTYGKVSKTQKQGS